MPRLGSTWSKERRQRQSLRQSLRMAGVANDMIERIVNGDGHKRAKEGETGFVTPDSPDTARQNARSIAQRVKELEARMSHLQSVIGDFD